MSLKFMAIVVVRKKMEKVMMVCVCGCMVENEAEKERMKVL